MHAHQHTHGLWWGSGGVHEPLQEAGKSWEGGRPPRSSLAGEGRARKLAPGPRGKQPGLQGTGSQAGRQLCPAEEVPRSHLGQILWGWEMDTDGPSVTSSCPQAVPMNTQEHPLTTQRMAALGRGNS